MDDAMMARLLQTYGKLPTAENVAAAKEFFASNPQVAEHRAMGMRGSVLDDNSDLFAAQLEKLMQQTAMPQQPTTPLVAPPAATAPLTARPVQRAAPPTSQASAPSRQGGYGLGPPPTDVNPLDAPNAPPQTASSGGSGWEWLLALLGATAAGDGRAAASPGAQLPATVQPPEATYAGRMNPRGGSVPNSLQGRGQQQALPSPDAQLPNARSTSAIEGPQGRITDRTARGTDSSIGQEIDQINNRNATTRNARETQLRSEVDAENEQAARLQEQMRNRQRAQATTAETLRAGKRAFGGR